jgi:CO/xanthine dehydrogenase FAD-binding subunit
VFTLQNLVQPETVEEAYEILIKSRANTVLGGCAFLKMGSKRIGTAIELSKLNLDYIKEDSDYIEIGAMTTLREIETNPNLKEYFNGLLPKSLGNIIGVQFRNVVTTGATVFSKYSFSDFITALLVLDTEVELYDAGRIPLEEFLKLPFKKDILTRIFIKKSDGLASYKDFRNSASDYPVLNVAVSNLDNEWKIVVGARPGRAAIARNASLKLSKEELTDVEIEAMANMATEELEFGSNMRASKEYRKALCKVLIRRAVKEVLECM